MDDRDTSVEKRAGLALGVGRFCISDVWRVRLMMVKARHRAIMARS